MALNASAACCARVLGCCLPQGLIFYDLDDGPTSIVLRLNLHFSDTAFFLLMPFVCISLYTADRAFVLADLAAQHYSPVVYYVAKVRYMYCMAKAPVSITGIAIVRQASGDI
jgi:hypothetical protein